MGNCCSTPGETKSDNFSGPGRTLGSAPSRRDNATASLPAPRMTPGGQGTAVAQAPGRTPGRTLGDSNDGDAKAAAARAAQDRVGKAQGSNTAAGAKLQAQLDAQRRQTHNDIRKQDAAATQRNRDADAAAEARAWN